MAGTASVALRALRVLSRLPAGPELLFVLSLACADRGADSQPAVAPDGEWPPLSYQVSGDLEDEQPGGEAVIFLHGYGGRGPWLAPVARKLQAPGRRILLPTAGSPHARGAGAIWWEFGDEYWPRPWSPELAASGSPPSPTLARARRAVVALIREIRERYRPDRLALVGYSQGAMLALDVAVSADVEVDRVALIAGYALIDSLPGIEKGGIGTPRGRPPLVFIAHGRSDNRVPFQRAQEMRKLLEDNGFPVVFEPHAGGHDIEAVTIPPLRAFLAAASPETDVE